MINGKWNKIQYCFASWQTNLVSIFATITDLLDEKCDSTNSFGLQGI